MSELGQDKPLETDDLYYRNSDWAVNTGGIKIVAKRMVGRFRTLKWAAMSTWLPFFLGPYIRWNDQQAVLFDIPNRQFHFFDLTLYPQDMWMLTLTLIFFAILLAFITTLAGRVFCGYFCFQTIWTDIFTYIEGKCEGTTPTQAAKFNASAWTLNKVVKKTTKHSLWLMIALLTGLSFTAWFSDAFQLWHDYFTLQASLSASVTLGLFATGTYIFAGFMREQVCLWLCPYARLQSVMVDQETLLPHYDEQRGEPRAKRKETLAKESKGHCIDCNLCVAVCPTGIDIRAGQQQGCITCGLCIDACDDIMTKTKQPTGLIRYASHTEIHAAKPSVVVYKRPRVMAFALIMLLTATGVIAGFQNLSPVTLTVLHQQQPFYVKMSDGAIQNKYTAKVLNKTQHAMTMQFDIIGLENAILHQAESYTVKPGKVMAITLFVRRPDAEVNVANSPITFRAKVNEDPTIMLTYQSHFMAPTP